MLKIMLVCHANVCRSPMAMFILQALARERGMEKQLMVDSCGTSPVEIGAPLYPPVAETLEKNGIPFTNTAAKRLNKEDYADFDYFLAMDKWDLSTAQRIFGSDPANKLRLFMAWSDVPRDITDPAYTQRFAVAFENIYEGAAALLDALAAGRL